MVPGYGFELNDSLALFTLAPGSNPSFGSANDPAPDKRPMGSMTPTIAVRNGEPILLTGSYGSGFIPSIVWNVVANVVDHGMTLQQAVDAPRMWGTVPNVNPPSANFARNPGHPQASIDCMRATGDQIARNATSTGFGSTASAGVDVDAGALVGAVSEGDTVRASTDPAAAVLPRP